MNRPPLQNDITAFRRAFGALQGGNEPFPWQERLFREFVAGQMPSRLDLPTGLGKTSVMAIWLIARALADETARSRLPRRLVYVVDRRAVVDQATAEADEFRSALDKPGSEYAIELKARLGLGLKSLPISTLRGQHADNRDWLADPTIPAIIVGTVDMIGSRLLFSGYGVSPKMRPYHAGFLGVDALVVLDEAHLVPSFEALVEQVARLTEQDSEHAAKVFRVPPLRLMALSATGRHARGTIFSLKDEDMENSVVRQRVNASKWLKLEKDTTPAGALADAMARRAIDLAEGQHRVLVFCNSRKIAEDVYEVIEGYLRRTFGKQASEPGVNVELIVGARRVRERERLANSPVFKQFAHLPSGAEHALRPCPAFLVATSAGEVGVDIDADHMVCDLVAWERMVQRLGRVNRRGEFTQGSLIDVFVASPDKEAELPAGTPTIETCRKPFDSRAWTTHDDGRCDASPGALLRLRDIAAFKELIDEATTGESLHPLLTRAVLDAWSMTSLEAHPGRPKVGPWIRGWLDEDKQPPQTQVLWRRHLPIRENENSSHTQRALDAFFDAAPPHISEILETEVYHVVDMLRTRARVLLKRWYSQRDAGRSDNSRDIDGGPSLADQTVVAVILTHDNSIKELLRIGDIPTKNVQQLQAIIANYRVVLDARLGGLAASGLLDSREDTEPATLDGDDAVGTIAEERSNCLWSEERLKESGIGFRVRVTQHGSGEDVDGWKVAYWRFRNAASEAADDADATMEWRVEEWVKDDVAKSEPALARATQTLRDHHGRVVSLAARIASNLNLPADLHTLLVTAAQHHDCGKARVLWQRYAGNSGFVRDSKKHPPLAKFVTRGDPRLLRIADESYRHEFGSVRDAVENKVFDHLPSLRALGLHLIVAHHGGGRPAIVAYDEKDLAGNESVKLADQLRADMTALVSQWGLWGLAWWDIAASREDSAQEAN
jgi:CRISPR-associated endonuclease/helicase Cas3